MCRFSIVCFGALLTLTACGHHGHSDMQPVSYAAVHAQPTNTLPQLGPARPRSKSALTTMPAETDVPEGTPQITFDMRFVEAAAASCPATGFLWGSEPRVISAGQRNGILKWAKEDVTSSIIASPRIRTYSGTPANLSSFTTFGFVQDVELTTDVNRFHLARPIAAEICYGRRVDIKATLDGDAIVFDRLDVSKSELLGMRWCRGVVRTVRGNETVAWEEPHLLQGSASTKAGEIRIEPGQSVVLPLRYRVIQPAAANVRAIADAGSITEDYRSQFEPTQATPSPLSRQCVVVVEAQVVEDAQE